jgi:nucleoid-associated protein YgaU
MGVFDFLANAGKKLLGKGDDATEIKKEIESSFKELPVEGLAVSVVGDTVTLTGIAKDTATKEKAILIAGNVDGIAKVNADQLKSKEEIAALAAQTAEIAKEQLAAIPKPVFYTIVKGDTLWKISEKFYKDGSKYTKIVDANLEVIKDADKIYPGQAIRIPSLV